MPSSNRSTSDATGSAEGAAGAAGAGAAAAAGVGSVAGAAVGAGAGGGGEAGPGAAGGNHDASGAATTPALKRAAGMNVSSAGSRSDASEGRRAADASGAASRRRACRSAFASNGSRPLRTSIAQHRPMRSSQLRPLASGSQVEEANSTTGPTNRSTTHAPQSTSTRSTMRQKPAGPKVATCTDRMPKLALPSVTPRRPWRMSCTSPKAVRSTSLTATSTSGKTSAAASGSPEGSVTSPAIIAAPMTAGTARTVQTSASSANAADRRPAGAGTRPSDDA